MRLAAVHGALWRRIPYCLLLVAIIGPMLVNAELSTAQADQPVGTGPGDHQAYLPFIGKSGTSTGNASGWPMVAANPQRTSWTPEEVRGPFDLDWYRPIEPYIPYDVQPIAANGAIYVATARGLYAFSASNGDILWIYPTELPLGNAPTIAAVGAHIVAYVGGLDRQIHAINTATGQPVPGYTAFVAPSGFDTNPLVIRDSYTSNTPTIFVGSRNGVFYALNALTGALIWQYQAGGPISHSAAYKNGVLYFAAQDAHAYALNASTGALVWKSAQLPGPGFTAFWPVIYTHPATGKDYVVFSGGEGYRFTEFSLAFDETDRFTAQYSGGVLPTGQVAGDWVPGTATMDVSLITSYYANNPAHRRVFFLDSANGQEFSFANPGSGQPTYAPLSWSGSTYGGNKYPGVVNGFDGVYYQQTAYNLGGWVSRGAAVGWKFGTQYVSRVQDSPGNPSETASDEPTAYASGGSLLYFVLCCDRTAGAFDVSRPFGQANRAWTLSGYDLASNNLAPGYQQMYNDGNDSLYYDLNGWQIYSGKSQSKNGVYGKHGTAQAPPIPYEGKVYLLRGNALMAFSPTGSGPRSPLPLATVAQATIAPPAPARADLTQRLAAEVQKMLAAGPLRPGYHPGGFYQLYATFSPETEMGEIFDYFQNPADTVATLLLAYPYLSSSLQTQVKTYLQNNYGPGTAYDFTSIVHTGWSTGAPREWAQAPADWLDYSYGPFDPATSQCNYCGFWEQFPPFNFYAAWKYAQIVGNNNTTFARNLFNAMSSKIEAPATDNYLLTRPYFINLYAAGYLGYLELKALAGLGGDATVQGYYNHMLDLRTNGFSKDTPYWDSAYTFGQSGLDNNRVLSVARNFMFLTPEIAAYMRQHIQGQVQAAFDEYNAVAPYWLVAGFDNTMGEGSHAPLYDYPALFQAKAYILQEPYAELAPYIDVPAFRQGDLFYIQNLVAALSAN
jgi:outer membrane protein assembly factor BamB